MASPEPPRSPIEAAQSPPRQQQQSGQSGSGGNGGRDSPRGSSNFGDDPARAVEILKMARRFFALSLQSEEEFETLGTTILRDCRNFFNADRASLLIAHHESGIFRPTFWDFSGAQKPEIQRLHEAEIKQLALPLTKGIAGDAFQKQEIQVVDDAQTDSRFFREVDDRFQYKIRSIMSVPCRVAVLNLYNKGDTLNPDTILTFNQDDIESATILADMLAVVLEKALLAKDLRETEKKLKVTWDVLSYRLGVTDAMVTEFQSKWDSYIKMEPHPVDSYSWDSQHMTDGECVAAFVSMMYRLGYVEAFNIDHIKLIRFGLTVSRNYRAKESVAYHNLGHSTAVTHGMYLLIKRYGLKKLLGDDTELIALLLACYCHDLDHRGLTNAYLKSTNNLLSDVFRHSVMEEHHANFAVSILTAPECDILENLAAEDFKHVLHMMRANIVSTDLSVWFQRKAQLTELVTSGALDLSDKPQRRMVRGLAMNCCDLIAMALPFRSVLRTVDVIYEEFFSQGDLEKSQGLSPQELMDRDKINSIPQQQIGFVKGVALPMYSLLSSPIVLPRASELVGLLNRTVAKWERWVATGQGYTMGCHPPWSDDEEEADAAKEAEEISRHWRFLDEEDLREKREEEERQRMATSLRRQSIAAANVDALRRVSSKAPQSKPGQRRSINADRLSPMDVPPTSPIGSKK